MGYDFVADTYDEVRALPNWVFEKFYEKIFETARLNSDSLVLDAGIGSGRTVGPLLARGVHIAGVDISKRMLAKAADKVKRAPAESRVDLIRADFTHLPFRPHCFDMVISIHVLWLIQKWKTAIGETARVLKPKGFFVTAGHSSPEFDISGIGVKCWDLEYRAFGYKRFLSSKDTPIVRSKRVFIPQIERFSSPILQILGRNLDWQSYLAKKARSQKTFAITRNTTHAVPSMVAMLERRASSLEQNLPVETIEKFREHLAKWTREELKKNSLLELKETFTFTMVQF